MSDNARFILKAAAWVRDYMHAPRRTRWDDETMAWLEPKLRDCAVHVIGFMA